MLHHVRVRLRCVNSSVSAGDKPPPVVPAGGQSAVQRVQGVEGGAYARPELLLPGESVPRGHLPLPHLQQERGTEEYSKILK